MPTLLFSGCTYAFGNLLHMCTYFAFPVLFMFLWLVIQSLFLERYLWGNQFHCTKFLIVSSQQFKGSYLCRHDTTRHDMGVGMTMILRLSSLLSWNFNFQKTSLVWRYRILKSSCLFSIVLSY